jgi:hypothetical protein
MTPLFSICHTTARPNKWRGSYDSWIARAANSEQVEYVLCIDKRWGFGDTIQLESRHAAHKPNEAYPPELNIVVGNTGPKSCVSGWNTAAAASTGKIIILNADDMRPPQDWDEALRKVVIHATGIDPAKSTMLCDEEMVIHVSVGGEADKRGLIILQILSRARYKRLGYALYPEYDGMYSDNEFQEHAKLDGCYIDARHLRWRHYHPFNGFGLVDEVYNHQNRPESYESGRALFEKRKAEGFPAWKGPYLDERSVDINSILDSEQSYKRERHK